MALPFTPRPARVEDIERICRFAQGEEELFFFFPKARFPLTPEQLRQAIAQRSDSTVLELDGEVVAFANFYRWDVGGRCSIGNVIVAPEARGRGAARYLMEHMVATAAAKFQATEVTVSCFSHNVGGLLLYPKLGFQPYAIEERVDPKGNRVALVHMRLVRRRDMADAPFGAQSELHPGDRHAPHRPHP